MKTLKLSEIAAIHLKMALDLHIIKLNKDLKRASDKDANELEVYRLKTELKELLSVHGELGGKA